MRSLARLSIAIAVLALSAVAPAANPFDPADPGSPRPRCDGKFGLCRYLDAAGQEVIPPRYEVALAFSEGLAAVRIDGRFGYIDRDGRLAIEPRFDFAGAFHQGLAEIALDDHAGVIDRSGAVVVTPRFRRAVPLTRNVIIASEGGWQPGYAEYFALKGVVAQFEQAGLYHIRGHWIRRPGPELRRIAAFESGGRGLVWATVRGDRFDLIGLLAADGTWVVEPQYEYAGRLLGERAIVRKRIDGVTHSGAVDPDGRLVVPLERRALFYWLNGQGLVRESFTSGKQALVDKSGNIIGGRWFDRVISRAEEGDIAIVEVDGRAVGLDRAGNIVANPNNGRVIASCPNGIRVVEIDGRSQITDANGRPTVPYLLDRLGGGLSCDRPIPVRLNGKQGYVGLDGRLLFDPPRFDNQYSFVDGYAVVQQGGKWGIIDASGRFTVEPKLDRASNRGAGLFHVSMEGKELWIDATGNERPAPQLQDAPPPGIFDCGHGFRLFESGGRWGIVDSDGKHVIAPRYRALTCFQQGVAWAPIDARRQWCPVGPDGFVRDRPMCRPVHYPIFRTHAYPEKFHDEPYESSVLWTQAYLDFGAGRRETPPRWVSDRR